MAWHFFKAVQRPTLVRVILSNRDVGDEASPDASDADTMVQTWTKTTPAQTNPQFVAMVKRETVVTLAALNNAAADTDVSATFAV